VCADIRLINGIFPGLLFFCIPLVHGMQKEKKRNSGSRIEICVLPLVKPKMAWADKSTKMSSPSSLACVRLQTRECRKQGPQTVFKPVLNSLERVIDNKTLALYKAIRGSIEQRYTDTVYFFKVTLKSPCSLKDLGVQYPKLHNLLKKRKLAYLIENLLRIQLFYVQELVVLARAVRWRGLSAFQEFEMSFDEHIGAIIPEVFLIDKKLRRDLFVACMQKALKDHTFGNIVNKLFVFA